MGRIRCGKLSDSIPGPLTLCALTVGCRGCGALHAFDGKKVLRAGPASLTLVPFGGRTSHPFLILPWPSCSPEMRGTEIALFIIGDVRNRGRRTSTTSPLTRSGSPQQRWRSHRQAGTTTRATPGAHTMRGWSGFDSRRDRGRHQCTSGQPRSWSACSALNRMVTWNSPTGMSSPTRWICHAGVLGVDQQADRTETGWSTKCVPTGTAAGQFTRSNGRAGPRGLSIAERLRCSGFLRPTVHPYTSPPTLEPTLRATGRER